MVGKENQGGKILQFIKPSEPIITDELVKFFGVQVQQEEQEAFDKFVQGLKKRVPRNKPLASCKQQEGIRKSINAFARKVIRKRMNLEYLEITAEDGAFLMEAIHRYLRVYANTPAQLVFDRAVAASGVTDLRGWLKAQRRHGF